MFFFSCLESSLVQTVERKRSVRDAGHVVIKENGMDVVDPSTKAAFVCEVPPYSEFNTMDLQLRKINYDIFKNQLNASRVIEETLDKIYSRLTTAGREIIPGDLKLIIDFLDMVSSAVNSTVIIVDDHLLKKITSVVDLTIQIEERVWHQLNKRGEQAATRLVNYMENIVVRSAANITVIVQDTLAIIIAQSEADIHFPIVHEVDAAYNISWLRKTKNSLYLSHNASQTFKGALNYSIIVYDGLKNKLMVNQEKQIR
ncbi:uncharacterized protein LOC131940490 [Physella acuta]|uniref:uncharacterized protein LOC131940490 n=1 Tax=Physella acuta TaxID=109671 RepID=UPI0027DDD77A|nr:uncharacterized protein LOC131940490 [Physella acuta]